MLRAIGFGFSKTKIGYFLTSKKLDAQKLSRSAQEDVSLNKKPSSIVITSCEDLEKASCEPSDELDSCVWWLFILNKYNDPRPTRRLSKKLVDEKVELIKSEFGPDWNEILREVEIKYTLSFVDFRGKIIFVELLLVWRAIIERIELAIDEDSPWRSIIVDNRMVFSSSIDIGRLIAESHEICVQNELHGSKIVEGIYGSFWQAMLDSSGLRNIREHFPEIPLEFIPGKNFLWRDIINELFVLRNILGDDPSMWVAIDNILTYIDIEDDENDRQANILWKKEEHDLKKRNMSPEEFEEWKGYIRFGN